MYSKSSKNLNKDNSGKKYSKKSRTDLTLSVFYLFSTVEPKPTEKVQCYFCISR